MKKILAFLAAFALGTCQVAAQTYPSPIFNNTTTNTLTVQSNATVLGSVNGNTLGPQPTTNPYVGPFPSYLYGIGGTGYYNTNPLATNALYNGNAGMSLGLQNPYGDLNTAVTANFAVGSNRPGGISGYIAPGQVANYFENGGAALTLWADSQPVMASAAGTFTATTFTPTTPIAQSSTVFAAVGMWVRTNDSPPFNGQITSFTTNGSNAITQITVSNWYQANLGNGTGAGGTPTGTMAFLNPQDKTWGFIPVLNLNSFTTTGDVTNGSNIIANVASTAGVIPNGQFLLSGSLFPAGTYVTAVGTNSITVSSNATGTSSGATLSISAGSQMNHGVAGELDIQNTKFPYSWSRVTGTGTTSSGSYSITGVTNVTSLRPGMYWFGAGVPTGSVIDSISGTTVILRTKATASATVSYTATPSLEEGGTALDCSGVVLMANTCFLQRGAMQYGFYSMGAGDTSFLVRPNGFAPIPNYGFLVDHSITPTGFGQYDFAVNGASGTTLWGVASNGSQIGTQLTLNATASQLQITAAAGNFRGMTIETNGLARWGIYAGSAAETGGNAGSDLTFIRSDDTGAFLGNALTIQRSSGAVTIYGAFNANNATGGSATKYVCSDASGNWFAQVAAC